jgi:hypothetical protein
VCNPASAIALPVTRAWADGNPDLFEADHAGPNSATNYPDIYPPNTNEETCMKTPNLVSILLLSILFTVVTVGSSIAAAPSSRSKLFRCTEAAGSTLHPVADTGNGKGEKCCYPRNKTTGKKTCIKCTYPGGDSAKAICTKNQFKSWMDTPNLDSQNLPTTNAQPKPLTRMEKLQRPRFNPGGAFGKLATPDTLPPSGAQRAEDRYMGR